MDLTCFVKTVFNLTGFDFLNGFGNVERYCSRFRVWHKTFTPENTTEFTNFSHHVRSSNANVELEPALLDFSDYVSIANIICASCFCFFGFIAFCKNEYAFCFTSSVWKYNYTTNGLVLFLRIYTQTNSNFDSFVKFCSSGFLNELDCFGRLVSCFSVNQLCSFLVFLTVFSHYKFPPYVVVAENPPNVPGDPPTRQNVSFRRSNNNFNNSSVGVEYAS